MLSPLTTVTGIGGSLSLVWVDFGPSHIIVSLGRSLGAVFLFPFSFSFSFSFARETQVV